jgi:hypothetical protein
MAARRKASDNLELQLENRLAGIEQVLVDQGVKYTYMRNLSATQIDLDRSISMNKRIDPIDPVVVESYKEQARNGAIFPPVVLYRTNQGNSRKFLAADGVHRAASHAAIGRPLDAYVLDPMTSREVIEILTMELNTLNGKSFTPEELLANAATAVENHQYTHEAAAKTYRVKKSSLQHELRKRLADRRAIDANIDSRMWNGLTATIRVFLAEIKVDETFSEAAKLAHDARLSQSEVRALVKTLKGTTSTERQKQILTAQRKAFQDHIVAARGGKTSKKLSVNTPPHRVNLALGYLSTIPDNVDGVVKSWKLDDCADTADRLDHTIRTLANLRDKLRERADA